MSHSPSDPVPSKEDPCAGQACENTDRHLWPLVSKPDDPYESIHVTKEGNIGINVCGNVIVQSLRAWHAAAGGTPGRALGDEQPPSNQWGIDEAFKTLESLTEGSSAAKGAMQFLRGELSEARRENVRWENAHKILLSEIERLKRPAHEREPPHCSNCGCGLAPEPAAERLKQENAELRAEILALGIRLGGFPDIPDSAHTCTICGGKVDLTDAVKPTSRMGMGGRSSKPPGAGQ